MPRGTDRYDEARLQGRFAAKYMTPGGLVLQSYPGSYSFSAAAGMFNGFGTNTVSGQNYVAYFETAGTTLSHVRLWNSATPGTNLLAYVPVTKTPQAFEVAFQAAASNPVSMDAAVSNYTGAVNKFFVYAPNVPLNGYICGKLGALSNAAFIATFRHTATIGVACTLTYSYNKTAGSALRVSDSTNDGTTIVNTTSALSNGIGTISFSYTPATQYITFGASGAVYSGNVFDVYIV